LRANSSSIPFQSPENRETAQQKTGSKISKMAFDVEKYGYRMLQLNAVNLNAKRL
jgi:hypothetical protein